MKRIPDGAHVKHNTGWSGTANCIVHRLVGDLYDVYEPSRGITWQARRAELEAANPDAVVDVPEQKNKS